MDAQRKDICRVSVEYRSMCRSSAGRVSTDISADTGPILDRHSANIRSTLSRCVDRVSTATRPTYRPSVDRWCRPIVSTDTTYSKHDPDFLGINFEMAFQRTDYEFVCYVLLRTYLHYTAFNLGIYFVLWDDIYNIFKWNSYENIRTYFQNLGSLNLL